MPPLLGSEAKEFGAALVSLLRNDPSGFSKASVGVLKQIALTGSGEALLGALQGLAALRKAAGIDPPARKLTDPERATLTRVYGDAIDYGKVEVSVVPKGLVGNDRAMAVGNSIFMPDGAALDGFLATLVHESAHVWQYQNGGPSYIAKALKAQLLGDRSGPLKGYDFGAGVAAGKGWAQLSPEQQAHLVQTAYQSGWFDHPDQSFTYDGKDFTALLRIGLEHIRSRDAVSQ